MQRGGIIAVFIFALLVCQTYSQQIGSPQLSYRLIIAQKNRAWINEHNSKEDKSFTMKDYEEFIDQTFEELSQRLLLAMPKRKQGSSVKNTVLAPSPKPSPTLLSYFPTVRYKNVNWTQRGMVSQVKQQGNCGSCYAFAAIADIESSYLFKGKRLDLSEQQIIDCSKAFGNQGCGGGWMTYVFAFVMLKGVSSQQKYPYTNQTLIQGYQGSCLLGKGEFKIKSYSYTSLREYDCQSLGRMIEKRPVTVTIAADMNFFYYSQGVLNQCGEEINHGVLLTGVYQDGRINFWMVKNSWGKWWGMQGYAYIDRYTNYGNLCQICYSPSYSII